MKKFIAALFSLTLALGLFLTPVLSQAYCDITCEALRRMIFNQILKDTQNLERELVDQIAEGRDSDSPATDDVDQNIIYTGPIGTNSNDGDTSDSRIELIRVRLLTPAELACRNQRLACLDRIPDSDWYPIEATRDCEDEYNICMDQAATRNAAIEAAQAQKDQATGSTDGDTSDSQLEPVRNMRPIDSGFYYNLRNAQFQTQEETVRNIRE